MTALPSDDPEPGDAHCFGRSASKSDVDRDRRAHQDNHGGRRRRVHIAACRSLTVRLLRFHWPHQPLQPLHIDGSSARTYLQAVHPDLARLADYLREDATAILTGAGISTESGIPDYRGPTGTLRNSLPIRYQDFVKNTQTRRRYWARSAVGYPRLKSARPNAGHRAVARMPDLVPISGLITQNVDGLHQVAGTTDLVELHGNLREVVCLSCGAIESRDGFQERLHALNRSWSGWDADSWEEAPDGDARLPDSAAQAFVVPDCRVCGGPEKPNVVFFGESVPKHRVEAAFAMVKTAGNLLVLGSSLYVFSGFRFARAAHQAGSRIAIINDGKTRADDLADIKIPTTLGATLEELARELQTV